MGFVAAIAVLQGWASLKTLQYYDFLLKRQRRKLPTLSINPHARFRDSSSEDPISAHTPSSKRSGGGGGGPAQRILLLPDPSARAREAGCNDLPMLSLTASSPARTSFPPPPPPHASTSSARGKDVHREDQEGGEPKYLVYAPVRPFPFPSLLSLSLSPLPCPVLVLPQRPLADLSLSLSRAPMNLIR